jgi:uncharacterized protein involved in type VI secretion and phage assembly
MNIDERLEALAQNVAELGVIARRYYGKYRGLVVDNSDPQQIGRVRTQVPGVLGETLSLWAMPCVPAAGVQAGFFIVPPVGSQVWVEFEQGDPDSPIWTGGFWNVAADVPVAATPRLGQSIVLQTIGQNTLAISDAAPTPAGGGIILKTASGAMIVVNDSGIFINNGQGATITLIGSTVFANAVPLTVGP